MSYICNVCNSSFTRPSGLERHKKTAKYCLLLQNTSVDTPSDTQTSTLTGTPEDNQISTPEDTQTDRQKSTLADSQTDSQISTPEDTHSDSQISTQPCIQADTQSDIQTSTLVDNQPDTQISTPADIQTDNQISTLTGTLIDSQIGNTYLRLSQDKKRDKFSATLHKFGLHPYEQYLHSVKRNSPFYLFVLYSSGLLDENGHLMLTVSKQFNF